MGAKIRLVHFFLVVLLCVFFNDCCSAQEDYDDENEVLHGVVSNEKLKPGEIQPVKWKKDGTPIVENLYRIGLPPTVRTELLKYIQENGIFDEFLEIDTDPLEAGESYNQHFNGENWFMHRPPSHWHSNMHWFSPAEDASQESYLRALEKGGFDEALDAIGTYLNMDGIVNYQLTFIGVTNCSVGFMHTDFQEVDGAYNVIIPLLLVPDSEPELNVYIPDQDETVSMQYEPDVGVMIGDMVHHATGSVNYGGTGKMRLAATVYLADVNEENAEDIVSEYTQEYPPRDPDLLLKQRGKHWKRPISEL